MFIYLFVLQEREREREYVCEGEGGERGRENPKQVPHCQCRAQCGDQSHEMWDNDLNQNQELDA